MANELDQIQHGIGIFRLTLALGLIIFLDDIFTLVKIYQGESNMQGEPIMSQSSPSSRKAKLAESVRNAWEGPASRATAAASLLALGFATPVGAANYPVTTNADAGAGSLRQAVIDANGNPGADTITFNSVASPITLTTGDLVISGDLTITGPGPANLTVSGNDVSRVINASNVALSITGLTLTHGDTAGDGGALSAQYSTVTLDNVAITNSNAGNNGGGAAFYASSVSIANATFSGNHAFSAGGGLWVNTYTDGGGQPSPQIFSLSNTLITGNTAGGDGGGAFLGDLYTTTGPSVVSNVVVTNNSAGNRGGGIYLYDSNDDPLHFRNITVSGNTAAGHGGGIAIPGDPNYPIRIENSTLSGNTSTGGAGGGLFASYPVDLVNVTITNNQATDGGGVGFFSNYGSPGFDIFNTVIAGNTGGDNIAAVLGGSGPGSVSLLSAKSIKDKQHKNTGGITIAAVSGTINASNSLIQSGGGLINGTNSNNILGVPADLGALADNGGPAVGATGATAQMLTHLPNTGSPAINVGSNALAPTGGNDQRGTGYPRIIGGTVDIGATETITAAAAPKSIPSLGVPAMAGLSALVALFGWRSRRRPS